MKTPVIVLIIIIIVVIVGFVWCPKEKLEYIGHGATAHVYYEPRTQTVVKKIDNYKHVVVEKTGQVIDILPNNSYKRELYFLKRLNDKGYAWCPRMLGKIDKYHSILMSHHGSALTSDNKPANWKEQIQQILQDLKKDGVRHNDISASQLVVKDGRVVLLDYGFASCSGKNCPEIYNHYLHKQIVKHNDDDALNRLKKTLIDS